MAKNRDTKIVSVISGKGGTGKSLFTVVLGNCLSKENCRVLLVDMDIYVRGLSILLAKYMGTSDERMAVSKCLEQPDSDEPFATFRFQECEFIPSVLDIAEPLNRNYDKETFDIFFNKLEKFVSEKFDIILLDCRSGLDDMLVSSAKHSDFIISISEDDDVCLQANTNLVNYLRYEEKVNNIYTVINKGRRIKTRDDIETKINNIFDFSCIGAIPFDERIMEDYGKDRFWLTVYETLYFYGIVRFWRRFQEKTQLSYKIDEERYNFKNEEYKDYEDNKNNSKKINKSKYISITKTYRIYGLFSLIIGIFLPIIPKSAIPYSSLNFDWFGFFFSIIGLFLIFVSSQSFRMLLLGKDDNPKLIKKEDNKKDT